MNYYYDFIISLDYDYHYFYELEDPIIVKKIPIIRISHSNYIEILRTKFKVDKEFLSIINNKSKFKKEIDSKYICIFTDNKNAFVVEFNNNGESINKSSLLLEDELNICELSYSNQVINLNYNIFNREDISIDTIQSIRIKKYILLEIESCLNKKNYNKLKFIYLEWFNKMNNNIEDIVKDMHNKLNSFISDKEYEIYKLIKLSYNNV